MSNSISKHTCKKVNHPKNLVKLSRESIRASAKLADLPKITHCHQLIAASFGFVCSEFAKKMQVPYIEYHNKSDVVIPFALSYLVDRVKDLLDVDEWTAQRVAQDVLDIIKDNRISVDSVRILFDPVFEEKRDDIIHGSKRLIVEDLAGNVISPKTAIEAVIAELIPRPNFSLKDLLQMTIKFKGSSLAKSISNRPSYLLMFPTADVGTNDYTRRNFYSENLRYRTAEIGVGFAIVQKSDFSDDKGLYAQRYIIYTHVLSYRHDRKANSSSDDAHWRSGNVIKQVVRQHQSEAFEANFPDGLESLPQIFKCDKCDDFYTKNSSGTYESLHFCGCHANYQS